MTDQMISDSQMLLTILDQLCQNETPILIAQEEVNIWGTIKDVNVFSKRIAIRPLNLDTGFSIDPNLPVLIRSKSNNLFFETKVSNFLKRNLAIFRFPHDIMIENARQGARFYFDKNDFPIYCNNFTLVDYSIDNLNWKAKILDISESGVALQSTDPVVKKFNIGDTLIFTFINTYALPQKLTGDIVYIKEQNHSFKIGIKFEYIIPIYDVLDHLKGEKE